MRSVAGGALMMARASSDAAHRVAQGADHKRNDHEKGIEEQDIGGDFHDYTDRK
jgi:hypothetical protein